MLEPAWGSSRLRLALCGALLAAFAASGCGPKAPPDPPPPESAAADDPLAPMKAHLAREMERQVEERRFRSGDPGSGSSASVQREIDRAQREEGGKSDAFLRRLEQEILQARIEATGARALYGCVPSQEDIAWLLPDAIRHRRLSRDDFRSDTRGKVSPVVREEVFYSVAAYSSVSLACVASVEIRGRGTEGFEAEIEALQYLALLDRGRSWWNDAVTLPQTWILRHEQLHFDLAENEARRLTREGAEVRREVRGVGSSEEAAYEDLARRWEAHMKEVQRVHHELQDRYDRETMHGYDPRKQTEWLRRGVGAS